MKSRSLTGSRPKADDRRATTRLMTVFVSLVMSPLAPARADEHRSRASLIDRAVAARWLPQLTLGASVSQASWSRHAAGDTLVYAALGWPLDTPSATVPALRERRTREVERESRTARLADAWHRRRVAEETADDVAARLALEEADAEIDALDEDGP
ncbi:MAG: hypothetical protein JWN44_1549 [Myxococcales bacterium]|nr:hypothetical protein [Myxococcales bacterium]